MANVKEGDLAKIVWDSLPENIGKQVLVRERLHPRNLAEAVAEAHVGLIWICEALQPIKSVEECGGHEVSYCRPGSLIGCPDKNLRRIDPPADWQDLYETETKEKEHDVPQAS